MGLYCANRLCYAQGTVRTCAKPASSATRVLTWGLVAACLVGQLSAFIHLGLVRHAVCAEHGASTHATEAIAPVSREAAPGSGVQRRAPEAGPGHGHCMVAAHQRERALSPGDTSVVPSLQAAGRRARAERSHPDAPIPLLRLAPKSSPPASIFG
jgi:hypothetical protein